MMKTVKRIFLFFLLAIVLIISTGIIIAHLYKDKVKNHLIGELNNKLKTEIGVSEVSFSVLRKFPLASLEFSNVWCKASGEQFAKDTLFKSEKVFVQFHIMDIFNDKYSIVRLDLEKGLVNIKYDKQGNGNYNIWEKKEKADENSDKNLSIDLERIVLSDIKFFYTNPLLNHHFIIQIGKMISNGRFAKEKASLNLNYDLLVEQIDVKNNTYLKNQNIIGALELNADSSHYEISSGFIKTGSVDFDISGFFKKPNSDDGNFNIDITLTGKQLNISSVLDLLPDQETLKTYTISGTSDMKVVLNGQIGKGISPSIQIDYKTYEAKVKVDSIDFEISEINMNGVYKYQPGKGKYEHQVEPSHFDAQIGSDVLKGKYKIWDFKDPKIDLELNGKLGLKNLQDAHLPGLDSIQTLNGEIEIEGGINGPINAFTNKNPFQFNTIKISGILMLKNIEIQKDESTLPININEGELVLNNNDIFAEELVAMIKSNRLIINGYFKNALAFILSDNQQLRIDAKIQSEKIDLNEFLKDNSASNKKDTIYEFRLPSNIDFDLNLNISNLAFRRFKAKQIRGSLKLKNHKLIARNFSFHSMEGLIKANGVIDATNENLLVSCNAAAEDINITKLFFQFENFGQNYLSDQNIKGKTNANIQFASIWQRDLTPIEDQIFTKADITIRKGELINFEPLMALSEYIDLSELKHVKFSNLNNQITIKNRKIYIPNIEVLSSALNITTSGAHSFDHEIDYKFKIYLPELLGKKSRKAKKENNEFGVIEDDGLGMWLFLTMTGTVGNPIIKYDKRGYLEKIGKDLKDEKQTMKQILNEEFGWFKKDTTITQKKKGENKKKKEKFGDDYFIIEWNEEDITSEDEDEDDDDF